MGYSSDQTRMYNAMLNQMEEFKTIKKKLMYNKCPDHKKRLKLTCVSDNDYSVEIQISEYCCTAFADVMEKELRETQQFDIIKIM